VTPNQTPPDRPASTTHLALEAFQYVLLALVSVLVAVVVIAAFIRIVKQPVPDRGESPTATTVPVADSVEAHWVGGIGTSAAGRDVISHGVPAGTAFGAHGRSVGDPITVDPGF